MQPLRILALLSITAFSLPSLAQKCGILRQSGATDRLATARCFAAKGELDLAAEQIELYREAHPLAVDGAVAQAEVRLQQHEYSDAANILAGILAAHPQSVSAMTIYAEVSKQMNNPEQAERFLIQCTKDAPGDPETWKRLGDFYLRKQSRDAIAAFSRAVKLRPDDALALAGRGSAEADLQMQEDAKSDFAHAVRFNSQSAHPNAMVDWLYADFLAAGGRKSESLAWYDRAIREDSSLKDAYLGRAKAAMAVQKWNIAESDLERLSGDPNYAVSALALLVNAYRSQGNLEKARSTSQRLGQVSAKEDAQKSAGHEIAFQLETAAGQIRDGKCDHAIPIDEALLKSHPEVIAAKLQLGRCYLETGQLNEAESALRAYIDHDRSSPQAYALLGKTQLRAGGITAARETFTEARRIDPLMQDAWLGLAACSMQERNYPDAEKVLRGALALSEPSIQTHLMLAECLYKQHRAQEAMREVDRALAIDPADRDALRMKSALAATNNP
jgi:tetratricopeptide (TPR) repeat protein